MSIDMLIESLVKARAVHPDGGNAVVVSPDGYLVQGLDPGDELAVCLRFLDENGEQVHFYRDCVVSEPS